MKKVFIMVMMGLLFVGCSLLQPSQPVSTNVPQVQTSIANDAKQGIKTEKDIAESILFNARVLLNTQLITLDQYKMIRDAYEKLRKTQDTILDSYILLLRSPTSVNQSKYQLDTLQLIKDIQALTSLAQKFGVIKEVK